jgi:hypothetical protein
MKIMKREQMQKSRRIFLFGKSVQVVVAQTTDQQANQLYTPFVRIISALPKNGFQDKTPARMALAMLG